MLLQYHWYSVATGGKLPHKKLRFQLTKERALAAYLKPRTDGHHNTTISSDTRADWSDAFELVPSLQVAYVWHASIFTREVLNGLERIGFLYPQPIRWRVRFRHC